MPGLEVTGTPDDAFGGYLTARVMPLCFPRGVVQVPGSTRSPITFIVGERWQPGGILQLLDRQRGP
jgi:hypothetical protein